jgi:hypothetical protein
LTIVTAQGAIAALAGSMKVQILVDGQVVNTQIISEEAYAVKPSLRVLKQVALKAALEDRAIKISESLRASFRLFDVMGNPID